jgi:hypothetical protein
MAFDSGKSLMSPTQPLSKGRSSHKRGEEEWRGSGKGSGEPEGWRGGAEPFRIVADPYCRPPRRPAFVPHSAFCGE